MLLQVAGLDLHGMVSCLIYHHIHLKAVLLILHFSKGQSLTMSLLSV